MMFPHTYTRQRNAGVVWIGIENNTPISAALGGRADFNLNCRLEVDTSAF